MALEGEQRDAESPTVVGEGRRPRAVLPRIQAQPAVEEPSGEFVAAAGEGADHFGDALHLVRAASDALERMRARYREVETYAAQQADYYRSELAMAHAGIRDLQEQNLAREEAIQRLEAQLRAEVEQRRSLEDALRAMSDAAERLRDQAQQAEARAASAEAWLGRFQGEIATAFGEIPRLLGEIDQRLDGGPEPQARVAAGR